jgi:nucleoside-diphosphate-sugar epimerase
MLEHLNSSPVAPKRVVVMGAAGFVGGAVAERLALDRVPVLALGRKEVDLAAPDAAERLGRLLQPEDAVVAVSARAPCKDTDMLLENITMARAMARALARAPVAQVINISSDAVYADLPVPLTEDTPAAPTTLHGVMHLARELVFRSEVKAPLAILRPTLLFGPKDPHNGYGPNRFRRLAARGEEIVLFGEGEERRDHVFIEDAAELVVLALLHRSAGVLNIASGQVRSFRDIADLAVRLSGKAVAIRGTPRSGPMPHNGYRPFDIAHTRRAFPRFRFTAFEEAMKRSQQNERS